MSSVTARSVGHIQRSAMTWLLADLRDETAQRAEQLRVGAGVGLADVVREGGLPADLVRVWPIP